VSVSTFGMAGAASNYAATDLPQDRLVRKEVALGVIREIEPPQDHIGLSLIAPWKEVASDDVIFDYAKGLTDGLAPARAEDAESELARKDDYVLGQGRASIIDWALKDHYTASDVTRYRELQRIAELTQNGGSFPLTINSMTEDFASKVARDDARRQRKLYNRLEWLIMTGLHAGVITYNDGRIKFTVDYGRPAGQHAQAPASGTYASTTHDPINDIVQLQESHYESTGVVLKRAIASRKFLNSLIRSEKFNTRAGFVSDGTGGITSADPRYLIDGWGPQVAIDLIQRQTGLQFVEYDSVYRTRALGSTTVVQTRFTPQNRVIFLPDENDLQEFDDTEIGFAKTLTSPHPEGNWSAGFYEWEQGTRDPWGTDRGTGVKAFPVFLHMDKTVTWDVTL